MAHDDREVKSVRDKLNGSVLSFIDAHPRVGWYVAALTTLNTLLTLIGLFHH